MKIIFLLLLTFNVFAQDESCVALPESKLSDNISKLLEWFGAVDNQVEKAPCKVKTVPAQDEMLKFISSKTKGSKDETIHGVAFKDESPALIQAFKDLTTAKDSFGIYDLIPNQKRIATEFKTAPCDKVLCAMEKIWGKEYAVKLLYLKTKHGFNSSELAFENSDRFTNAELDDVIIGLEDLPQHLIPLAGLNQRLTHFKRGYTLKDYSSSVLANAVMMFFDPWDKKTSLTKQYTVFHELSHNISGKFKDLDESPEWLKLSGWVKKGDDWSAAPTACNVSKYGETNPWEDFAETLSSFRYNGAQLKIKCPEKFEFVKQKVFKGIDYTDVKNCTTVPLPKIDAAQKEIVRAIMNSVGTTSFEDKELFDACPKGFSTYPVDQQELAICSLKLHSSKADIGDALVKAGITDTPANRDLILSEISRAFTPEMMTDISIRSIGISDQIDKIVNKSFSDANPEGFSKKPISADDYRFRLSLKDCGMNFFSGKIEEVKQCQLKAMINQDRDMQKWDMGVFPSYKIPSLFFNDAKGFTEKREAVLLEHLSKQPLAQEVMNKEKQQFLQDLKYHHSSVTVKLYKMQDWKKMGPETFCKEAYGGGTSWTDQYGVNAGQSIPKIYDACVKEQSRKNKRFEFKEDAWLQLVNSSITIEP